ncbi:hypothetical protein [Pseudorhodobacter sp.]|uniref:hypothetical protein n=1 Tax=Pseudorhodobacter sp. TaxID=1934400 RepID=UPI002AFE9275|nr:hypothetical protein [Pseudorhodobacter sp.]
MSALTKDRNTPKRDGDFKVDGVAASTRIFTGALLMRNAAGFLVKGATATGCTGVGRAEEAVDNTGGANGAAQVKYRPGIFLFANLGADLIDQADMGKLCYIVNDQTVAASDGTGTRSPAGFVEALDDWGVWVRFDEAVTRGA